MFFAVCILSALQDHLLAAAEDCDGKGVCETFDYHAAPSGHAFVDLVQEACVPKPESGLEQQNCRTHDGYLHLTQVDCQELTDGACEWRPTAQEDQNSNGVICRYGHSQRSQILQGDFDRCSKPCTGIHKHICSCLSQTAANEGHETDSYGWLWGLLLLLPFFVLAGKVCRTWYKRRQKYGEAGRERGSGAPVGRTVITTSEMADGGDEMGQPPPTLHKASTFRVLFEDGGSKCRPRLELVIFVMLLFLVGALVFVWKHLDVKRRAQEGEYGYWVGCEDASSAVRRRGGLFGLGDVWSVVRLAGGGALLQIFAVSSSMLGSLSWGGSWRREGMLDL